MTGFQNTWLTVSRFATIMSPHRATAAAAATVVAFGSSGCNRRGKGRDFVSSCTTSVSISCRFGAVASLSKVRKPTVRTQVPNPHVCNGL